jgi:hypothetical protein
LKQADWVSEPQDSVFKDIRRQRDAVAEEKAVICKLIGERCRKPPDSIVNGSVNATRDWLQAAKSAMKVAGNKRASVHELTSALSLMGWFE